MTTDKAGAGIINSWRVGWKEDVKKQDCPICAAPLVCSEDWIMGGSHYYYFDCSGCGAHFNFSTYDFTLRLASPRSEDPYDKFIDTIKHHFPYQQVGVL